MDQVSPALRPARTGDAEALAATHLHAWQVGYRGILPQSYLDAFDIDQRVEQWQEWLARGRYPGTTLVVAELDGAAVGFAIYGLEAPAKVDPEADEPVGRTGELHSLNVHPDRWGAGIGSALISHACRALEAAGHRDAVLWVLPENRRARSFYERHDWLADGALRTNTERGARIDEVRYRRVLP